MIASFVLLARIRAGRGATDESAEALVEGARVADRLGLARLRAAVGAERVVQMLARGRIKEAHRVARDLPEGSSRHDGIGLRIDQFRTSSLAAVLSAQGEHDRAMALVEDLVAEATDNGQVRVAVELSIQLTGIEQRAARYLAAERTLAGVLDTVVAAGVPQLVHEGGPDVRVVLARIVGRLREGDVDESLPPAEELGALLATAPQPISRASAGDLNGRELEVVRMLDLGRSNQQIARALGVTVNTVKWHLKNIFSKLDVANRAEAASVARRGGLLV